MLGGVKMVLWLTGKLGSALVGCMELVHGVGAWGLFLLNTETFEVAIKA